MDKDNTIGVFFLVTFMATIVGIILGLIWAFALNINYNNSLFYGGIIGFGIGLLFSISIKSLIKNGKYKGNEAVRLTGSMLTGIFIVLTLVAFIVGFVRWVFF